MWFIECSKILPLKGGAQKVYITLKGWAQRFTLSRMGGGGGGGVKSNNELQVLSL